MLDATVNPAPLDESAPDFSAGAPAIRPRELADVWSATQPRHRRRATLVLLFNLLLFCGLCVFTHWLHVGRLFDFSWSGYLAPAKVWGGQTQNLNDFILEPISVEEAPVHAVVLGLLVAAIVIVPIVVSILYRFAFALPFVAAVIVFAHMPWMAVTLLGSCILASLRPFRMRFRFGSALLGLMPVLLYLYLATRGSADQITYSSPIQKMLLAAPWILAVLAAALMAAVILVVARGVAYQPLAVGALLAIMFVTPVVLFFTNVGMDELAYRVLEAEHGPRSPSFEPALGTEQTQQILMELLAGNLDHPGQRFASELEAVWSERPDQLRESKRRLGSRLILDLLADRAQAYEACKNFIADHPRSRYLANVLFIQARVLDTRLDQRKLYAAQPRRELYVDYPHVQAESAWSALATGYPDSPLAAAANLRLAQLRLRAGDIDAAERHAGLAARGSVAASASRPATQSSIHGLLAPAAPESSLDFDAASFQQEARRLHETIAANRDDPRYGNEPLRQWACLDPHRAEFPLELLRLIARFPGARLEDNWLASYAATLEDARQRREALASLVGGLPSGDGAAEATFKLAELEILTPSDEDSQARRKGIDLLRQVIARFPGTSWAQEAQTRLAALEPQQLSGPRAPPP